MNLKTKEISILNSVVVRDNRRGTGGCKISSSINQVDEKTECNLFTAPCRNGLTLRVMLGRDEIQINVSGRDLITLKDLIEPYSSSLDDLDVLSTIV